MALQRINILGANIKHNAQNPKAEQKPVIAINHEDSLDSCNEGGIYHAEFGLVVASHRQHAKVWLEHETIYSLKDASSLDNRMKIIHVNQHNLIHNLKLHKDAKHHKQMITMKVGGKSVYCDKLTILGKSEIVYNKSGLSCGAKVYVVTFADVVALNPQPFTR